jgi:hypothetical protein
MYGFKRQPIDREKAFKIYTQASTLHQPEATSALAVSLNERIMLELNLGHLDSIPVHGLNSINKYNYRAMWIELQNMAILNYVSPFLLFQTNQVKHNGTGPLSKTLEYVLDKHALGEKLEFNFESSIRFCDSAKCDSHHFELIQVFTCQRCLKKFYCSERCEHYFYNDPVLMTFLFYICFLFCSKV